ncbi:MULTISPECIES: hypothetical protein [unclassified Mycolicibacterium]|uniref:hypothetical protein n=1 Tax=unclassified Mycolicibacterium TaxID=2636767 RepID=UPI001391AEF3|nr:MULTISPECIES: hypothetical protein [unclassified Mycolicibacterium]
MAAFATHEASPEQSVPFGESPPQMYGVPEHRRISATSAASLAVPEAGTDSEACTSWAADPGAVLGGGPASA